MLTETVTPTTIEITSPYNRDWAARARQLGGTWDAEAKKWVFPITIADAVRDACRSIYGVAPSAPGAASVVDVRITAKRTIEVCCGAAVFAGREVMAASGKFSGVRRGGGVALISGEARSGGSAKYWLTIVEAGTVLHVTGVPEDAAVETADWAVEIVRAPVADPRADLIAERERLLSRLAEIDAALAAAAE